MGTDVLFFLYGALLLLGVKMHVMNRLNERGSEGRNELREWI